MVARDDLFARQPLPRTRSPKNTALKPKYIPHWLAHRAGWVLCWFGARFLWKSHYEYEQPFPQDGPVLLLCNHTSALDPIWVAWGGWRPMHYMASQQLFRFKALAALIRTMGAFPKIKNTRDRKANQTLEQLYEDGRCIVLFPEGARTWDGRLHELRPGIGRLVKRLNARIVVGRVTTGHLHRPRWAPHARDVPVHVQYSAPRRFPDEMSAEEITDEIAEAMRIDPDSIYAPPGSSGERLAEGLPFYLWACLECFEMEALYVEPSDRDVIACNACSARWRVDVHNRLHALDDHAEDTAVHRAAEDLESHFGDPPVADEPTFDETGIVLESPDMEIGTLPRGERTFEPVVRGRARAYEDRLECESAHGETWVLPFEDVKAISVELESVLQLRTEDCLYQLEPGGESTVKWAHFLRPWHARIRWPEDHERAPEANRTE
jgi:1-acyl-sn-glycerol-3-phosphate acyltransferase